MEEERGLKEEERKRSREGGREEGRGKKLGIVMKGGGG